MFELKADDADLRQVHVSLVLGHGPRLPDLHFDELRVNGELMVGYAEGQFPGGQGIVVSLGWRDPGETVALEWRIKVSQQARPPFVLRWFRNAEISKLKKLADYPTATAGQVLAGSATITVE